LTGRANFSEAPADAGLWGDISGADDDPDALLNDLD
jgi:hypothetical protein